MRRRAGVTGGAGHGEVLTSGDDTLRSEYGSYPYTLWLQWQWSS